MREIHYTEDFSYGDLRQALSVLDFEQHTGRNEFGAPIRVFYDRAAKVTLAVPDRPDETPLEPMYLRIAERALVTWDIADSESFFRLLREAAQKKTQAA